ncbi:MAG: class I SAM-dependent methyltransferase [Candidatus Krumholzibacteria bacterium]|nr:class I SAM-dependent methyltransferase [Candidatus Krumholzibacteria bacterium]
MNAVACPVCGRAASRDPFYHDWHGRRFWLMRCGRCTHQFIHPPITGEEQDMIFRDEYFSAGGGWVGNCWDEDYLSAEPQLRLEAKEILGMLGAASGRLLDVGCAGGVFLDEARRSSFEVDGIELNASMARIARERFGLEPVRSRIEDVEEARWGSEFDVITFLDVLEHIPEPGAALSKAARWLKHEGLLFIRGPLKNSRRVMAKESARRMLRMIKRLPGYPLDANQFNVRSMETLLARAGFNGIDYINRTEDFSNILARRRLPR